MMPSYDGVTDDATPARWGSLCEDFTAIRFGAYRHDLAASWRKLVEATPGTPNLLDDWELLREQIDERDALEVSIVTRHWPEQLADASEFDDDEDTEYVCPGGRCDRLASAPFGAGPRCELLGTPMKPKRNSPE